MKSDSSMQEEETHLVLDLEQTEKGTLEVIITLHNFGLPEV